MGEGLGIAVLEHKKNKKERGITRRRKGAKMLRSAPQAAFDSQTWRSAKD
jgi:hypothetical protein